jgi:hypothetical protein
MRPFLTLLFLAAAASGPPYAQVCAGRGVVAPSGEPIFMRLAGLPMPGWLKAFGTPEMGQAYGGFYQRVELGGGTTLAVLRDQGLLAAYAIKGERCLGDLVGEPLELPSANDAMYALKRGGFRSRKRFMATRAGDFAVDAEAFERVAGGYVERYVFTTTAAGARHLSLAGYFPAALRGAMDAFQPELEAGVATYFKDHP